MPTLVIDNVPVWLYDRIHLLAKARQRTPSEIVLEVLEAAVPPMTPTSPEAPLPQEPFVTEEICASFSIPRPTRAVWVPQPLPTPHDLPNEE